MIGKHDAEREEERKKMPDQASSHSVLTDDANPKLVIGDDYQLMVEIDLQVITDFFLCKLCKGYFREAHTIPECLHTFCKSCLVQRLRQSPQCPEPGCQCKTSLHAIKLDRNIDSLFQKLFPDVQKQDDELEEKWYQENNIRMPEKQPSQQQLQQLHHQTGGRGKKPAVSHPTRKEDKRQKNGDSSSSAPGAAPSTSRQPPVKVKLTLQAEDPAVSLDKPYIEASGGIKVDVMRGYIADKLQVPKDRVILSCNGQALASEHTTEFIQRTKWTDPGMNMVWTFRITQSPLNNAI
jgi:hypothetical protein